MPSPRFPLALALFALVGLATPALAQVEDRAWEECKRNPEPDWVVFNCTAVIEGAHPSSNTRRARALMLRAGAFVRKNAPEKARADFTRALSLAPRNGEILAVRADFLLAQGEVEAAAEGYEAALALDPAQARPWFGRAMVARQKGDTAGAVSALDKVLAIDPRYPRARTLRADWQREAAGAAAKPAGS